MDDTSKAAMDVGLNFLLSEFRDLRKGMESRDQVLRASIDGVRDDVQGLSSRVDLSRMEVDGVRKDVDLVREDLQTLSCEVDDIKGKISSDAIKRRSAWTGPMQIAKVLSVMAGIATAIMVLAHFGPQIATALFVLGI